MASMSEFDMVLVVTPEASACLNFETGQIRLTKSAIELFGAAKGRLTHSQLLNRQRLDRLSDLRLPAPACPIQWDDATEWKRAD